MIDLLFMRMLAIYGTAWLSQFPNEPVLDLAKREWEIGIDKAGFDEDALQRGVEKCRQSKKNFPPSLPLFLSWCEPERVAACHRRFAALPKPKPNPDLVKSSIAEMRRVLRGCIG